MQLQKHGTEIEGEDRDVCLVYLYEVPRTYEAVNFSIGA